MQKQQLQSFIQDAFAGHVGLPASQIFGNDMTLAQIIGASERLYNSVDLMEAFARTANALKREHGIKVRLPAFTLDTSIADVLATFMDEAERSGTVSAASKSA